MTLCGFVKGGCRQPGAMRGTEIRFAAIVVLALYEAEGPDELCFFLWATGRQGAGSSHADVDLGHPVFHCDFGCCLDRRGQTV